jgi:hypothetical protein
MFLSSAGLQVATLVAPLAAYATNPGIFNIFNRNNRLLRQVAGCFLRDNNLRWVQIDKFFLSKRS